MKIKHRNNLESDLLVVKILLFLIKQKEYFINSQCFHIVFSYVLDNSM